MNRAYAMTAAILIMAFVCPGGAGAESSLHDSAHRQAVAITREGEPRWYARQLYLAALTPPSRLEPRTPGPTFLTSVLKAPLAPSIRFGEEEAVIVGVRGWF
jgi:hypothetical protein